MAGRSPVNIPPAFDSVTDQLMRRSLTVLPYLSYLGIVGLIAVTFGLLGRLKRTALDPVTGAGLALITGLMVLSSLLAVDRAEAGLQLANFLPFFLMFAVLPLLLRTTDRLVQLATTLVITSLPINLLALVEYLLRANFLPQSWRRLPGILWVRQRPHAGRAIVTFNHPNALASYLVVLLGLGLGLLLYQAVSARSAATLPSATLPSASSAAFSSPLPRSPRRPVLTRWVAIGTYSTLIGIFCSGSRNGLLVAVAQLLGFGLFVGIRNRASRTLILGGFVGVGGLIVGAIGLGIGGRSLSFAEWAADPRLRLWQIALQLFRERPWFGWGLGNYKFEFPDRLLAAYPDCLAQRQLPVVPVACADVTHPHNLLLLLLAEAGLLVAVAVSAWFAYLGFRAIQTLLQPALSPGDRAIGLGYLLGTVGLLAFGLFDVTLYDARVNTLNWVVLAGLYSLTQVTGHSVHQRPGTGRGEGALDVPEVGLEEGEAAGEAVGERAGEDGA